MPLINEPHLKAGVLANYTPNSIFLPYTTFPLNAGPVFIIIIFDSSAQIDLYLLFLIGNTETVTHRKGLLNKQFCCSKRQCN